MNFRSALGILALVSFQLVQSPNASAQEVPAAVAGEAPTVVNTLVDFESAPVNVVGADGKTLTYYGPWIDGGSYAYHSATEAYGGVGAFTLVPQVPEGANAVVGGMYYQTQSDGTQIAKPNYGSLYTDEIDFTGVSRALIEYKYLVTDSALSKFDAGPAERSVKIEASIDGGLTYNLVKEIISEPIDSFDVAWRSYWEYQNCTELDSVTGLVVYVVNCLIPAPAEPPGGEKDRWWTRSLGSVEIPSEYLTTHTILRIKSYYGQAAPEKLKFNIDDLQIVTEGAQPQFSRESIAPIEEPLPSSATLFNEATFNDWGGGNFNVGVWTDGGRSAYLTQFFADASDGETGEPYNYGLRYRYVEGELNPPDPVTGEDQGEHKPTYSSIVMANTDLSAYDELTVEFDFVAYNTIYDSGDATADFLTLSATSNAGFDYVELAQWTSGIDFINGHRYKVRTVVPASATSDGRFTTTTQLRIQSHAASIENQFYIDNVRIYVSGNGTPFEYGSEKLEWSDYESTMTVVKADTTYAVTNGATYPVEGVETPLPAAYDLFNRAFIKDEFYNGGLGEFSGFDGMSGDGTLPCSYGAVEHTDVFDHSGANDVPSFLVGHTFGPHINMYNDPSLGTDAFMFSIHQSDDHDLTPGGWPYPYPDTDRCRTDQPAYGDTNEDNTYRVDRQRLEVKTYDESPDHLVGLEGETHYISWKMLLPPSLGVSNKFTHLHQLKPKGGCCDNMPTFTLTAVSSTEDVDADQADQSVPPQLNLRYSPTSESQVTASSVNFEGLTGKWVQIAVKIHHGGADSERRYEIVILDPLNLDADPIFQFGSDSLVTYKGGFNRTKWGIYRSIQNYTSVHDENIGYADFVILEANSSSAINGDLIDFAAFANGQAGGTNVDVEVSDVGGNLACQLDESSGLSSTVIIDGTYVDLWMLDGEYSYDESTEAEFCQELYSEYGSNLQFELLGRCPAVETDVNGQSLVPETDECGGVVIGQDSFDEDGGPCLTMEAQDEFVVIHNDQCAPISASEEAVTETAALTASVGQTNALIESEKSVSARDIESSAPAANTNRADDSAGDAIVSSDEPTSRSSASAAMQTGTSTTLPQSFDADIELVQDKTFRISWSPSSGAKYYRVMENPDGVSSYYQIGNAIDASSHLYEHRVALYTRMNASYIVEACNDQGCLDSEEIFVHESIGVAAGYFKAIDADVNTGFGKTVALSADGNTMAVRGGILDSEPSAGSEEVYVFNRLDGAWILEDIWKPQGDSSDSKSVSEGSFGDTLSISASGDLIAVGSPREMVVNAEGLTVPTGAVYVYERVEDQWHHKVRLAANNLDGLDSFGASISLSASGHTLAVGAVGENSDTSATSPTMSNDSLKDSGAAFVFEMADGKWHQTSIVRADASNPGDAFGSSVSLSDDGNTLAVGAQFQDEIGVPPENASGAAYVFSRSDSGWEQQAVLKADDAGEGHHLGNAISLDAEGGALVVAARSWKHEQGGDAVGAVYLFKMVQGAWQQDTRLTADLDGESFGQTVAMSSDGSIVAVGSRGLEFYELDSTPEHLGLVSIYSNGDAGWELTTQLTPPSYDALADKAGSADYTFGSSISLSRDGKSLAIGAPVINDNDAEQNDSSGPGSGAVFLY